MSFDLTDSPTVHYMVLAFQREMQKCTTCTVYDVALKSSQFGPGFQQVAQQAVLQHPDATYVDGINDGTYLAGIQAGIHASTNSANLKQVIGEGTEPGIALLRAGAITGELAYSGTWLGWATADTLNSVFAGKAPRNSGIGWQIVDKLHSLPTTDTAYVSPIDFKSVYRKLWGVS